MTKIRIHEVFETAYVVLNATSSIFAMTHVLSIIICKSNKENHVVEQFVHENPHSIVISYIQKFLFYSVSI